MDLARYDITKFGFLPDEPVRRLSESMSNIDFDRWEAVMSCLPELNENGKIRETIDGLPDFDISKITTDEQLKRAYTILTLLTNSYVWQGTGPENPPKDVVCRKLAIPLWQVSQRLRIAPILTHASVDLYNWEYIDPAKGFDLDNLKSTSLMTGEDSEAWFYLIMVAIEYVGGSIIRQIIEAKKHIDSKNNKALGESLFQISKSMEQCCDIIGRMRERCKPEIFWNVLRPYLAGWKNNDALPNGMLYEGVGTDDERHFYFGGSAAQSSLLAVIDASLQIDHESPYFFEIQEYMPGAHRDFIEYATQNIFIRDYIDVAGLSELEAVYNEITRLIVLFRSKHRGLVQDYILNMIQADKEKAVAEATATAMTSTDEGNDDMSNAVDDGKAEISDDTANAIDSDGNADEPTEKGTGGTDLKQFLGDSIKESQSVKFPDRAPINPAQFASTAMATPPVDGSKDKRDCVIS